MFNRKTLFIVGAGAGVDVGMPIGTELAEMIASKTNLDSDDFGKPTAKGDQSLLKIAWTRANRPKAEMQRAGRIIAGGIQLTSSIDDFLHLHQKNPDVVMMGKLAIVKTILEREKESDLFIDQSNIYNRLNLSKINETWYVKFMRMLSRGVPLQDVDAIFNNVSFITFNYDRCIEHFLFNALMPLYAIDSDHAKRLCERVTVLHAYGRVGPLPGWRATGVPVEFGGRDADIYALAKSIRTYNETVQDDGEINAIKEAVATAEVIVFLGFGFHPQNMKLLNPGKQVKAQVFAMAYECSQPQRDLILDDIGGLLEAGTFVRDPSNPLRANIRHELSCPKMFDEYARQMTA